MTAYLSYMEQTYPDKVTLMDIGQSTENRSLLVAKVSTGPAGVARPAIWIDGGEFVDKDL